MLIGQDHWGRSIDEEVTRAVLIAHVVIDRDIAVSMSPILRAIDGQYRAIRHCHVQIPKLIFE